MTPAGIVSIISFGIFLFFGYLAHWFDYVLLGYWTGMGDPVSQTRALVALAWLLAFTMRNELKSHHYQIK